MKTIKQNKKKKKGLEHKAFSRVTKHQIIRL